MLRKLKESLPPGLRKKIFAWRDKYLSKYAVSAYSQEGEDMILNRFFSGRKSGFFVDIGAHHPMRFSNTYFFYKKGWQGINVDAMPGSMEEFRKWRKRDVNLEVGISKEPGEMTFYCFDEPAVNSFSEELSEQRIKEGTFKLIAKKKVKTQPLSAILDQYLPEKTEISFLSIDVEGLDLEVLQSNNWAKYRPEFILIEHYNFQIPDLDTEPVFQLLQAQGYSFAAKAVHTLFFRRNK